MESPRVENSTDIEKPRPYISEDQIALLEKVGDTIYSGADREVFDQRLKGQIEVNNVDRPSREQKIERLSLVERTISRMDPVFASLKGDESLSSMENLRNAVGGHWFNRLQNPDSSPEKAKLIYEMLDPELFEIDTIKVVAGKIFADQPVEGNLTREDIIKVLTLKAKLERASLGADFAAEALSLGQKCEAEAITLMTLVTEYTSKQLAYDPELKMVFDADLTLTQYPTAITAALSELGYDFNKAEYTVEDMVKIAMKKAESLKSEAVAFQGMSGSTEAVEALTDELQQEIARIIGHTEATS